jgi:hypothetical protein
MLCSERRKLPQEKAASNTCVSPPFAVAQPNECHCE